MLFGWVYDEHSIFGIFLCDFVEDCVNLLNLSVRNLDGLHRTAQLEILELFDDLLSNLLL